MNGYILVDDDIIMECDGTNCNTSAAAVTTDCDAAGKVSKLKVNEGALQLCLIKTGASPAFALTNLNNSNVYYAGTSTSTYNKYVTNSDQTIIVKLTPGKYKNEYDFYY